MRARVCVRVGQCLCGVQVYSYSGDETMLCLRQSFCSSFPRNVSSIYKVAEGVVFHEDRTQQLPCDERCQKEALHRSLFA